MENLNKNLLIVLAIELAALIIPINLKFNEVYFVFWYISIFAINSVGIVFLIRNKPKYYGLSIAALLLMFLGPLLYIFYELSQIQC